jgi:RNA polymerase sigma-70 factor (ECF subfamily)
MIDIKSVLDERKFITVYLNKKFRNIRPDDIDDIVQVSLLNACKNLHRMQEKSTVRTWLTRIAVNDALDFLRKSKVRPLTSLSEITTENTDIDSLIDFYNNYDPLETIASRYTSYQLLCKKLSILKEKNPDTYKTFMSFVALDNYKEVQEAENISIGTVKSRINRARKILIDNISDEELALISI